MNDQLNAVHSHKRLSLARSCTILLCDAFYFTHDIKHSGGFPGLARKESVEFMAYMRIGPIHLAAGVLGIEGPTLIHDGGIPFPSGNVGGGVFSLEGLT